MGEFSFCLNEFNLAFFIILLPLSHGFLCCNTSMKNLIFGSFLNILPLDLIVNSIYNQVTPIITLALGSRPSQWVARLRAKREARESHHMFPGVQRVWGNELLHSQMNSHCGNWSPKWTLALSKHDCRGLNLLVGRVFYIIGNLLKRRYLKWARIAYLDI
jgi:hypothetical protein